MIRDIGSKDSTRAKKGERQDISRCRSGLSERALPSRNLHPSLVDDFKDQLDYLDPQLKNHQQNRNVGIHGACLPYSVTEPIPRRIKGVKRHRLSLASGKSYPPLRMKRY
jgi:hypothetical protein